MTLSSGKTLRMGQGNNKMINNLTNQMEKKNLRVKNATGIISGWISKLLLDLLSRYFPMSPLLGIFGTMCRNRNFSVNHLQTLLWQTGHSACLGSSKNISLRRSGCWQIWWNEVEAVTRGGGSTFCHEVLERKQLSTKRKGDVSNIDSHERISLEVV